MLKDLGEQQAAQQVDAYTDGGLQAKALMRSCRKNEGCRA